MLYRSISMKYDKKSRFLQSKYIEFMHTKPTTWQQFGVKQFYDRFNHFVFKKPYQRLRENKQIFFPIIWNSLYFLRKFVCGFSTHKKNYFPLIWLMKFSYQVTTYMKWRLCKLFEFKYFDTRVCCHFFYVVKWYMQIKTFFEFYVSKCGQLKWFIHWSKSSIEWNNK